VQHTDPQPQERTDDGHPGSSSPPAVEAETNAGREGELETDGCDSSTPVHPDGKSRPAVGFLTHRRLPFCHARHLSERIGRIRKAWTAQHGRRQAGKPWKRSRITKRQPSHDESFIQGHSRLSTTQQPASRNFSQSPRSRCHKRMTLTRPGPHCPLAACTGVRRRDLTKPLTSNFPRSPGAPIQPFPNHCLGSQEFASGNGPDHGRIE